MSSAELPEARQQAAEKPLFSPTQPRRVKTSLSPSFVLASLRDSPYGLGKRLF